MPVQLANLLFDSVSPNTGDIAIGIAGAQVFESIGVKSRVVDPFSPTTPTPLVIGGGELIRTSGDFFYDKFRAQGPHILNAAGVWSNADDLSHLSSYSFVSTRSSREAEVVARWRPDVSVLPCATTLLTSDHYKIPGVEEGEPLVGIHVVPHSLRLIEDIVQIVDSIPHKKVFIPFTHYNADLSFMQQLPFDRSNSVTLGRLEPLQLHSILGQLTYSLVSSLHASIFSYSQNVPFASVYQKKTQFYFDDRGLGDHLVSTSGEVRAMLERLENEEFDFSSLVEKDRVKVRESFAAYADIIAAESTGDRGWRAPVSHATSTVDAMLLEQAHHVIRDRDLAIAHLEARRIQSNAELAALRIQNEVMRRRVAFITKSPLFRLAKFTVHAFRAAKRGFRPPTHEQSSR